MAKFEPSDNLSALSRYCKKKYNEADLAQHNWSHIVRNLYRAEEIAETEKEVDMEVLYAATMLHDIGTTVGEYQNHDENSRKLAREKLPELGFSEDKTENIVNTPEEFAGEKDSQSIEAKILSDADKLEKSSLGSIGNFFSVHYEWNKDPKEAVKDLSRYKKLREKGFYTEKAKEINDNGIQERIEFLERYRSKLEERKAFTASEKDLKLDV
jgi:uncharacterized protein